MKKILLLLFSITFAFSLCLMLFSCKTPASNIGNGTASPAISEDDESPNKINPPQAPRVDYSDDTEDSSTVVLQKRKPNFDTISLDGLAEYINHNADPPLINDLPDQYNAPGASIPYEYFKRANDSLNGKELTVYFDEIEAKSSFELVFYPATGDLAERTVLFYDQTFSGISPIVVIFETDYGNAEKALSPVQLSGKIIDVFLIPWNEYMYLSSSVYQMTTLCNGEIPNDSDLYYSCIYQGEVDVACLETANDTEAFKENAAIYDRTLERYNIELYP